MSKIFLLSVNSLLILLTILAITSCSLLQPQSMTTSELQELYLFVQTANSGTLTAVNPAAGLYRLTLENVSPRVLFFSDRPNRDTGSMSLQNYLNDVFAASEPDPNGALVIEQSNGAGQFTLALELSEPAYNLGTHVLTYQVQQLYEVSEGLSHMSFDLLETLPAQFGAAELFIDSGDYHRCYGKIENNSSHTLTLDKDSMDPPYSNDNNWGDHPPSSIAAKSSGDWTFRFHTDSQQKTANINYLGPDSDSGVIKINFYTTCYTYKDALGHEQGQVDYDIGSSGCGIVGGSIFVITCEEPQHGKGGQQIIYVIDDVNLP